MGGIAYASGTLAGVSGGLADSTVPTVNNFAGQDVVTYNGITYQAMNATRYLGQNTGTFTVRNTAVSFSIGAGGITYSNPSITVNGTFTGGGSNAWLGYAFTITGANAPVNNGTFICTSSSATQIVLTNMGGVTDTTVAGTISSSAVVTSYNGLTTPFVNGNSQSPASNPWGGQQLFTTSGYHYDANNSATTTSLTVTGVSSTGSAMTLTGGWAGGGSSAYVGQYFTVSGFTAPDTNNNSTVSGGPYICTASSAGSITLTNPNSPTSGHAGAGVATFAFVVVASTTGVVALTNAGGVTETATLTGSVTMNPTIFRASPPTTDLFQANQNLGTNDNPVATTFRIVNIAGVQTAVNGPYNNTNVWQPFHYDVWRTNDGLKPIYIRWTYYADGTGHPNPAWSVGWNMRDSIIMNRTYPSSYEALLNSVTGTVSDYGGTHECNMAGSGTAGWLTMCMWRSSCVVSAASVSLLFALERANDHQGNHLDTYFTVLTCARLDSLLRQMTLFRPGAGSGPPALSVSWCTAQLSAALYGQYGSPISPVWPLAGFLGNPLTVAVSASGLASSGDVMEGTIFPAVLYGNTHYYLACNNAGGAAGVGSTSSNNVPAIRFEAA